MVTVQSIISALAYHTRSSKSSQSLSPAYLSTYLLVDSRWPVEVVHVLDSETSQSETTNEKAGFNSTVVCLVSLDAIGAWFTLSADRSTSRNDVPSSDRENIFSSTHQHTIPDGWMSGWRDGQGKTKFIQLLSQS
jgi:hypothetical protein